MSEMTIKQLVGSLRNKAFIVGTDEALINPSRAKLDRHDSEARAAEQAVIDRMEAIERERDLLRRQAEEKDRQVEALVLLFGAEMSCGKCGLLGGPGAEGRTTCCNGVPDVCENALRQWSIEQAKKGCGGE